jgi:hypothetical protein
MAMNMAVESMEMAPGAIPHPSRVAEQRLLSLEIGLRWRQRYRNFCGSRPYSLGYSHRRQYIGGRAMSVGTRGAQTMWWHGQRWACTTLWCGRLSALLCLPFGLCVRDRNIGTSGFVSSNSKNIFGTTFLKYKNSRKQELALWDLVNRLVPENA